MSYETDYAKRRLAAIKKGAPESHPGEREALERIIALGVK